MNVLEITDSELYGMGIQVLTEKLGISEVPRFIRQCRPGKGDYSIDRHQLLGNQEDIDTITKRIQDRCTVIETEERARAKIFAAPPNEIRKMKDVEVYEIGSQVLVDKLGVAGSLRFIGQCQELNGGCPRDLIENTEEAEEYIKLYTASLTFNPKIVEDYIKRGNAYSYIGEYDTAIVDYDEAIKLKPEYAKAYYSRGNAYRDKIDFDKAITDYTKVIELKPNYAEAYYNRGKLYIEVDEYDQAINDFSMTIKYEPKHSDAYGYRAFLYKVKSGHDEVIEDLNMAIELRPDDAEAYYERSIAYSGKRQFKNAIEDHDAATVARELGVDTVPLGLSPTIGLRN